MTDQLTPEEAADERSALQGLWIPLWECLDVLPERSDWRKPIADLHDGIEPVIPDSEILEDEGE